MYTYMTVNKTFDGKIRVGYSKTEYVDSVDKIEHNLVREAMKLLGILKGVDLVYMTDIPLDSAGIGLASSSALTVGALHVLHAYLGKHVTAEQLAQEACRIEIDILGNPIGKQDQYAVAYGGFQRYQFNADGTVFTDPIICEQETLERLQENLMFFYTGITRKSGVVLKEQKANIPQKKDCLDRLVEIADKAEKELEANDLSHIGEMLDEAWNLKRQMASNVSNYLIDEMYSSAKKSGAVGGKILGAGGGGFLMLYVLPEHQEKVRMALREYREVSVKFEPQGSKIIYVG